MADEQYANNASTTVATSATGTGTGSKEVASTATFPATGRFRVIIESEICLATVVDGTHLNLLSRAQEGTSAASHAVGATVYLIVTAASLLAVRGPWLGRAVFEDDFAFGQSANTGTNGQWGLSWAASGGAGASSQASVAGHPGLARLGTGTTANAYVKMNAKDGGFDGAFLPAETFDLRWIFRLNQSDVNTMAQLGLRADANSDTPDHGIYLEKQGADTNWFYVCRASAAQTRADSGVACGTGWVNFRARRKDAGTISFSINDGTETDITTTIPTADLPPSALIKTLTTVNKTMDLDYFGLLLTGLAR